jgi:acyl carrier protein
MDLCDLRSYGNRGHLHMKPSRDMILADLLELLRKVASDWEFETPLTADTRLFSDLQFESLDVVVLGTAVQEHFGQRFPFPEFFAELGQREVRDLTVGQWVDFIHNHLDARSTMSAVEAEEPLRERI